MPDSTIFEGDHFKVKFFASGYCTAFAKILNLDGDKPGRKFYATWCLVTHLEYGNILFDTGYTERFYSATKKYPGKAYSLLTPVYIDNKDAAKTLLEVEGITAGEVNYIVISHFHADHIGGLIDFPNARFVCSRDAYEQVRSLNGWRAVKKGILKTLLPENFESRILFIEDHYSTYVDPASDLKFYRLFNLESLQVVFLPGHAKGMLGLMIRSNDRNYLFATDAAWDTLAFEKRVLPKKIVRFFFDSWSGYRETYDKLYRLKKHNPGIQLMFTHCPLTLNFISNAI
ncbi:MAG: MBL fold metallo-hydrolase [Ginsengibacter sp.]